MNNQAIHTSDSGLGSLRQAILNANLASGAGANLITFNIPTIDSGYNAITHAFTINLLSALPTIITPVDLDATGEWAITGVSGVPDVVLNGSGITGAATGLDLAAGSNGSTIRGFVIGDFDGYGINVSSNNDIIAGNYVGTNATGTIAQANASGGIIVTGSSNTIGGTSTAARNVISGNSVNGVLITGSGATGNLVEGDYIGVNAAGTVTLGNSTGVAFQASGGRNIVGGTAAGAGNLISGNADFGIDFNDETNSDTIEGNVIGLSSSGSALGNGTGGGAGILVDYNSGPIQIGGTTAAARNVISGNNGNGIEIAHGGSAIIRGNYIGTDATGTVARGNSIGIDVAYTGSTVTIGGTVAGAGNLISGQSAGEGIYVEDASSGVTILGNLIGTDATGTCHPRQPVRYLPG